MRSRVFILFALASLINRLDCNFGSKHKPSIKEPICQMCLCSSHFKRIDCSSISIKRYLNNTLEFKQIGMDMFGNRSRRVEELNIDLEKLFKYQIRLDVNVLTVLPNLTDLELKLIDSFSYLPELSSMINLQKITIHKSGLKEINKAFCAQKPHLYKIDFSNNKLNNLSGVFDECEHISLLDLSYNELASLYNVFSRNYQLTRLIMDNNRIVRIGESDLANLSSLEELSLSHNNIEFIDDRAFDHLVSLQKLNLERNNLKW